MMVYAVLRKNQIKMNVFLIILKWLGSYSLSTLFGVILYAFRF